MPIIQFAAKYPYAKSLESQSASWLVKATNKSAAQMIYLTVSKGASVN
jgi:hypothetical protein